MHKRIQDFDQWEVGRYQLQFFPVRLWEFRAPQMFREMQVESEPDAVLQNYGAIAQFGWMLVQVIGVKEDAPPVTIFPRGQFPGILHRQIGWAWACPWFSVRKRGG